MSTADAETFDLDRYLAQFDPVLLGDPEGRRLLTRTEPMLFALLYLPHHLRSDDTGEQITFGDLHLDLFAQAQRWLRPVSEPRGARDAYVAPRKSGKTTVLFTILPLWAAAHGHHHFAAAFATAATLAEEHLRTFKTELDTNQLLRHDFPKLCQPAVRPRGTQVADNQGMLHTASGFVFAARGIDSQSLGMKVGNRRPDLLILDDIEPDESNYSAYQKEKRLITLIDAILPLNEHARVLLVGTVTMPGSIIHDLVRSVRGEQEPEPWIIDGRWRVHYYDAIVTRDDGTERSMWPGRWSIDYLQSIRHTRDYRKNFANDPMATDGAYWSEEDFHIGPVAGVTRWLISVDPAVTTKTTSDLTGIAVIGYSPSAKACLVEHVEAVRLTGAALRQHLLKLLARFDLVRGILVEINQGGETWLDILHDMTVPVFTVHQTVKKEVRAEKVLNYYQRRHVWHARRLPPAEEQMVGFPKAPHDDLVDAVGAGVSYFLDRVQTRPVRIRAQQFAA